MDFIYYRRLKEQREDHDLSQQDIALLLNTTRQQVTKWENGIQKMGVDKYIKLAQYYNVSVDYLLGLIDEPRKLY
ncbi:MAG: helix-turn-helix transcriptional regulator [Clostridia bacterium]|nr:helix-turn-helix transcriptional regulator [Clostridia bacterium]